MSFEENLQKWIVLDNQLKQIYSQTKELRQDKNNIEEGIINYVDTHNLQNSIGEIDCICTGSFISISECGFIIGVLHSGQLDEYTINMG